MKSEALIALLPTVALLVWVLQSCQHSVSTEKVQEQTRVIAGVPVLNFHRRHYISVSAGRQLRGPRHASGQPLTDWVFMLNASNVTDESTQSICDSLGAGACLAAGHPTHGGRAFAVLRATDAELEVVLKKHEIRPAHSVLALSISFLANTQTTNQHFTSSLATSQVSDHTHT